LLKVKLREGSHRGANLLHKGPDHGLIQVVSEHLLLKAGEDGKDDLVEHLDLFLRVIGVHIA